MMDDFYYMVKKIILDLVLEERKKQKGNACVFVIGLRVAPVAEH